MKLTICIAVVSMFTGCISTGALTELRTRQSLELVREQNGDLGWAGIGLRMPRNEVEALVGKRLRVRTLDYVEVCGEYESHLQVAGRWIELQWSSNADDAYVQQIDVPLTRAEFISSSQQLSAEVQKAIPSLTDAASIEYHREPDPFPALFVLRNNPSAALWIDHDEKRLLVTIRDCLD